MAVGKNSINMLVPKPGELLYHSFKSILGPGSVLLPNANPLAIKVVDYLSKKSC
jgi:hypothetical protein